MRYLLSRLWRSILRPASFVGKEATQIRRQPQLIIALIVAPFLVLLLFGVGYEGQTPPIETVLVLPPETELSTDRETYAENFVSPLVLEDVTTDREGAIERLDEREIDLIVAFPPNAFETITAGQAAEIEVLYNELIPWQRNWLEFYSRVQTSEINQLVQREVLEQSMSESRSGLAELNEYPARLDAGLDETETALEQGDRQRAMQELDELRRMTDETRSAAGQFQRIFLATALSVGATGAPESPPVQQLAAIDAQLAEIDTGLTNASFKLDNQDTRAADVAGDLDYVRQKRDEFAATAAELPAVPVDVLVAPFVSREKNLAPTSPEFVDFYAPAVLALLIQHIAVTLTALALVRERIRGTVEMFRIAPVSAREVLTGKYLAYFLIGAVLSAVLALLIVYGLGVPLLGDEWEFVLVIGLVLAGSLGIGFLISALVRTETQAVQLAMILLLTAVFFSGFFLPLDNLWEPIRVVSYLLPVTYGIEGLQEVMLRGASPAPWLVGGPAAIALLTTVIAGLALQLQFRRR
jgi:ABC-2 type transport system permease protein